jgi:hypothetical protein
MFNWSVRRVYGKPWSQMAGEVPVTRELLNRLGEALVESVVKEARKDLAKQGNRPVPRGQGPVGLPSTDSFFDSFDYQIRGKSTIEITSSWPWVEVHLEGRPPQRMEWLTQERGVFKVPIVKQDGTVIIRTAPLRSPEAWIHPGFARHTFLERGIRKGRERMADIVGEEVIAMLMKGDPTR